jgi:hypothetical protein
MLCGLKDDRFHIQSGRQAALSNTQELKQLLTFNDRITVHYVAYMQTAEVIAFAYVSYFQKAFTRWFKYDRDYLCVNKSQFVPVISEPPCITYQSPWSDEAFVEQLPSTLVTHR